MNIAFEAAGWVGAILVLLAYAMVTRRGTSLTYHVINLVGAAGLVINAVHHHAFPSVGLNTVWIGIAIVGMTQSRGKRPAKAAS